MFKRLFASDDASQQHIPREGDTYKTVSVFGKSFTLYYGYYEDFERYSPHNEPMPIYPDFVKDPVYTEDGTPIVTEMQDICLYYQGRDDEDSCAACSHFRRIEELFGICNCRHNRRPNRDKPTDDATEKPNHTQGGKEI